MNGNIPSELRAVADIVSRYLEGLGLQRRLLSHGNIAYDIGGRKVFCHLRFGRGKHRGFYGLLPQIGQLVNIHRGGGAGGLLTLEEGEQFRRRLDDFVSEGTVDNQYYPEISFETLRDRSVRGEVFQILQDMFNLARERFRHRH